MKAAPILIAWHNENQPIYSAHFEPSGKGRLATAGGDSNVRVGCWCILKMVAYMLIAGQVWKVDHDADDRKITYLSTLIKHTQTVNVVRWCPKGTDRYTCRLRNCYVSDRLQARCWAALEMTAMFFSGCHPRIRPTTAPLVKTA